MSMHRKLIPVLFLILSLGLLAVFMNIPDSGVTFSHESGFYDEPFDLTLSGRGKIYYTLDGSVPTEKSRLYKGPIRISDASENPNTISMRTDVFSGSNERLVQKLGRKHGPNYTAPDFPIDKCTVVRAVSIDSSGNRSAEKMASFFVGFVEKPGYEGVNVISLRTDPANLFDYETGIYVTGKTFDLALDAYDFKSGTPDWTYFKGNFSQHGAEWERPAHAEFFDTEGRLILEKNIGIRLQGNFSRYYLPRGFNLYARESYDTVPFFRADLFGNGYQAESLAMIVSAGGGASKLPDYLMSQLISGRNFDVRDYVPYVLFLNGEYWGFYWLTEKLDETYVTYKYNQKTGNVWFYKDHDDNAEEADEAFYSFFSELRMEKTDSEKQYRSIIETMDEESFLDYYAVQAYISRREDWPTGNYALWRSAKVGSSPYEDGKWRWMLFDSNSAAMDDPTFDSIAYICSRDIMFATLWEHEDFRQRFWAKLVELSRTDFLPERVDEVLAAFSSFIEGPLTKEAERYYGKENTFLSGFSEKMDRTSAFFHERAEYIMEQYETHSSFE